MPKGRPPLFDIFPSRDFQFKHHKKYSLPFRQFHTSLTTASTSNSKSSTSISISTTATPSPKSKNHPPHPPAQNPPLNTSPPSMANTIFQKKILLPPPPLLSHPPPPLPPHQPKYLIS